MNTINKNKTHCIHGHPFDTENTKILKNGSRQCRACTSARYHARYQKSDKPRGWNLKNGPRSKARGEKHHNWKGVQAKTRSGNERARQLFTLGDCEICGERAVDRHHKNGDTLDNSSQNIQILCRKCHMKVDGRLKAFVQSGQHPKQPPKPCIVCDQPSKPLRKGRCIPCAAYLRRCGVERPKYLCEIYQNKKGTQ